jgi:hypothetical protein
MSLKHKYYKYASKNMYGGNKLIQKNADKFLMVYRSFIQNKNPLKFNENFGVLTLKIIIDEIIEGYKKLENKNICGIKQSPFLLLIINIIKSTLNFSNIQDKNTQNLHFNIIMQLHRYIIHNCIKYKYYDLEKDNNIDRTDNTNRYTQNTDENLILNDDYEKMPLNEINEMINESDDKHKIINNIINVYDKYDDDLFDDKFIWDNILIASSCIQNETLNSCFSNISFNLSSLYTYNFPEIINTNTDLQNIYNNIKYLHLPLAIYTYDSDILYQMNKHMQNLYSEINDMFFNDKYTQLTFIIIYCLLQVKNIMLNYNCRFNVNSTISYFPYKYTSSFVYRGILINKNDLNITRLEYQTKINSFSKNPRGVKRVLDFYYDKLINKDYYDTIILYIAKHDDNFIPVQFFNPQITVSLEEEEIVSLPFVKYNCKLIFEYDKNFTTIKKYTDKLNSNSDIDNIDIDNIHNTFFKHINGHNMNCLIYHIEDITSLIHF